MVHANAEKMKRRCETDQPKRGVETDRAPKRIDRNGRKEMLSAYELQRQRNIDRNQSVHESLGLADSSSNKFKPARSQTKKKRTNKKKNVAAVAAGDVPLRVGDRERKKRKYHSFAGLDGGTGSGASYTGGRASRVHDSSSEAATSTRKRIPTVGSSVAAASSLFPSLVPSLVPALGPPGVGVVVNNPFPPLSAGSLAGPLASSDATHFLGVSPFAVGAGADRLV